MIPAKPIISLFDRNFDHKTLLLYRLSIRAFSGGFSFSVKNLEESRYVGLEYYTFDPKQEEFPNEQEIVQALITQRPWLGEHFASLRWVSTKNDNFLCPIALNVESQELEHYSFNMDLEDTSTLQKDDLSNLSVYNFFSIDKQLDQTFRDVWSGTPVEYTHESTLLLRNLHIDFVNKGIESMVYLHFKGRYFEVFVFDKYRFQLYNVFSFQSSADFIYYLMNIYHQLNLKPDRVGLCLLGEIERQSDLFRMAHRYIKNLSFLRFSSSFKLSYVFDQLSEHRFYSVFCE